MPEEEVGSRQLFSQLSKRVFGEPRTMLSRWLARVHLTQGLPLACCSSPWEHFKELNAFVLLVIKAGSHLNTYFNVPHPIERRKKAATLGIIQSKRNQGHDARVRNYISVQEIKTKRSAQEGL